MIEVGQVWRVKPYGRHWSSMERKYGLLQPGDKIIISRLGDLEEEPDGSDRDIWFKYRDGREDWTKPGWIREYCELL